MTSIVESSSIDSQSLVMLLQSLAALLPNMLRYGNAGEDATHCPAGVGGCKSLMLRSDNLVALTRFLRRSKA